MQCAPFRRCAPSLAALRAGGAVSPGESLDGVRHAASRAGTVCRRPVPFPSVSASGRPSKGNRARDGKPAVRSRAVYRRRRLFVGLLALIVLGGAWGGVSAIAGALGDPSEEAAPDETAAATPGPTQTPTPTVTTATKGYHPVACRLDALDVRDHVANAAFATGAPVPFDLALVNSGAVPCLLESGSATLGVIVYSGPDRIWSSLDCPQEPAERELLLDVGVSAELVTTWDQVRSAPGCPDGKPAAPPGTYRAVLSVDGGGVADLPWERVFTIR